MDPSSSSDFSVFSWASSVFTMMDRRPAVLFGVGLCGIPRRLSYVSKLSKPSRLSGGEESGDENGEERGELSSFRCFGILAMTFVDMVEMEVLPTLGERLVELKLVKDHGRRQMKMKNQLDNAQFSEERGVADASTRQGMRSRGTSSTSKTRQESAERTRPVSL